MDFLIRIFGEGKELTVLQMSLRAIAVFLLAIILLRITGQRTFGNKSAVDQVVMIMLGAILSRGVTGSSPFLPVLGASAVIVLLHRLLGWLSVYSNAVGNLVKGKKVPLYQDGVLLRGNMKKCMVTEKDLLESVRIETNAEELTHVQSMHMERSGSISVVKKEEK